MMIGVFFERIFVNGSFYILNFVTWGFLILKFRNAGICEIWIGGIPKYHMINRANNEGR